jgi:hypothetical protein
MKVSARKFWKEGAYEASMEMGHRFGRVLGRVRTGLAGASLGRAALEMTERAANGAAVEEKEKRTLALWDWMDELKRNILLKDELGAFGGNGNSAT